MEKPNGIEVSGPGVEAILRVMDRMEKAWSEKNLPELFRHYWHDDGFVLFTSRGSYYGWPAAKQMLETYFADLEEIHLEFGARKVRRFGNMASVVYEWTTKGRSALDGTQLLREGYGTDVFLLQDGEWRLYHNHVSMARPGVSRMPEHSW